MPLFDNNGNVTIVGKDEKSVTNVNVTQVSKENVNVQDTNSVPVTQDVSLVQEESTSALVELDTIQPQEEITTLDLLDSNVISSDETSNVVIQNNTTISDENVVIQEEVSKVAETKEVNMMEESPPLTPVNKNVTLDDDVKEVSKTFIPTSNNTTSISKVGNDYSSKIIDGVSLMEMEFPEPIVIVDKLLHSGLSILAGMPKRGKSWFCLSLSLDVATGNNFLDFSTNECEVLYLSFESKVEELKIRLKKLLQDEKMPNGIYFFDERITLDTGLLEMLQDFVDKHPNLKLIIIDTLQFIKSEKSGGGNSYQKEYKEMSKLKSFADKNGVCILCVHHLKNTPSKDKFSQMYGSNAVRGSTNTNMVLTRLDDDETKALLLVESRDVPCTSKIIQMNENCRWEVVENNVDVKEMEYRKNPIVITINTMLQEQPDGIKVTMTEVNDRMKLDLGIADEEYAPQSISREISEHLIPLLMKYDNIRCKRPNPNGGASGRVWHFYYEKEDVTSSQEVSDVEINTDNIVL